MWLTRFTKVMLVSLASFLVFINEVNAQTKLDSLLRKLKAHRVDTARISLLSDVSWELQKADKFEESTTYIKEGLSLSKKLNYDLYDGYFYRRWASYYLEKGLYEKSVTYYEKAVDYYKKRGDIARVADNQESIGTVYWYNEDYDKALTHFFSALSTAEKLENHTLIVKCKINIGKLYFGKEEEELCLEWVHKAIKDIEKLTDSKKKADYYLSIGSIFRGLKNYSEATYYFLQAIDYYEKVNYDLGISFVYEYLADISEYLGNYQQALEYALKQLEIVKKTGERESLPRVCNAVGWEYKNTGDYENALKYYQESLRLYDEIMPGDPEIGYPIGNIAIVQLESGEFNSAIENAQKALMLFKEIDEQGGVAESYNTIGFSFLGINKPDSALANFERAMQIAAEIAEHRELARANEGFYKAYSFKKNFEKALLHLEKFSHYKDSLINLDKINHLQEMHASFESDKKQKQLDQINFEATLQKQQLENQKFLTGIFTAGSLALLFLLFIIWRNWSGKKKAYILLQNQNQEIQLQKKMLEEKNRDITDSIKYAHRIQTALLKPGEHISTHLPPHFIFYKPKDILSGDFYWVIEKNDYLYLAAVDCTGHGVPGALLSMLGIAFLNEIVSAVEVITPATILNQLRDKIIKELNKANSLPDTKDGMDISLIRLNLKTNELVFSGANNPLWVFRNNEISIYKGAKQSVAYSSNPVPFENVEMHLQPEDVFYLFSDGFVDQFGGKDVPEGKSGGKKFMTKRLKELLLSVYQLPADEQRQKIGEVFEQWKGDLEQVDDVCVIGVKVA